MSQKGQRIEYGILRTYMRGYGRFRISMTRRGRAIKRDFVDLLYGGEEEALVAARAYRDAILHVFPPITNRESGRITRSDNTSGVPGVYLHYRKGRPVGWTTDCISRNTRQRKMFSFSAYGSEQAAFEAAVAMREKWLAGLDVEFMAHDPMAKAAAAEVFSDSFEQISTGTPEVEESIKKLAEVDALFDSYCPTLFSVILRVRKGYRSRPYSTLVLQVKFLGKNVKRGEVALHVSSLSEALTILHDKAIQILTEHHGPKVCAAFMAKHETIFREDVFNPAERTWVRFLLPTARPYRNMVFSFSGNPNPEKGDHP